MKNLKFLIVLFTITLFIFTSCQKEALEPIDAEPTITTTNQIHQLDEKEGKLLAEYEMMQAANAAKTTDIHLTLENGDELHFFSIGDDGNDELAVIEVQKCSSCSASALSVIAEKGLTDYTAKDVYWAFSEPGMTMPFSVAKQQSLIEQNTDTKQGWGREALQIAKQNTASSRSRSVACDNNSFKSSKLGGPLWFDDWLNLDLYGYYLDKYCLKPAGFRNCLDENRYQYDAWWTNVRNWTGKICAESVQNSNNNHFEKWCGSSCPADPNCDNSSYCETYYGPRVKFQIKKNGSWTTMTSKSGKLASYIVPPNERWTYSFYSYNFFKKSFRIKVDQAKAYDEFDIMMDADNER